VAVGAGDMDGEAPTLAVVSFYRFADFPDHAAFRQPLKELVGAQISHLCWDAVGFYLLSLEFRHSVVLSVGYCSIFEA
jgi:hypothetical protein